MKSWRCELLFALILICLSVFAPQPSPAQSKPQVPCRPLAPEDTADTPAEIRARPYCSPIEPINCEVALVYLDQLAAKVQRDHDAYVIIVARLGTGERATSLSWNRLGLVKARLADYVPNTNVVTAIGKRVKGYGQLEFYVGGTLLYVLRYKRNLNINCEIG